MQPPNSNNASASGSDTYGSNNSDNAGSKASLRGADAHEAGAHTSREQPAALVCMVPGCGVGLSDCSHYLRRHRVCHPHLKSLSVFVDGMDKRFCQQCGRFQPLDEFKGDRRSCEAALQAHNARRRVKRDSSAGTCENRNRAAKRSHQLVSMHTERTSSVEDGPAGPSRKSSARKTGAQQRTPSAAAKAAAAAAAGGAVSDGGRTGGSEGARTAGSDAARTAEDLHDAGSFSSRSPEQQSSGSADLQQQGPPADQPLHCQQQQLNSSTVPADIDMNSHDLQAAMDAVASLSTSWFLGSDAPSGANLSTSVKSWQGSGGSNGSGNGGSSGDMITLYPQLQQLQQQYGPAQQQVGNLLQQPRTQQEVIAHYAHHPLLQQQHHLQQLRQQQLLAQQQRQQQSSAGVCSMPQPLVAPFTVPCMLPEVPATQALMASGEQQGQGQQWELEQLKKLLQLQDAPNGSPAAMPPAVSGTSLYQAPAISAPVPAAALSGLQAAAAAVSMPPAAVPAAQTSLPQQPIVPAAALSTAVPAAALPGTAVAATAAVPSSLQAAAAAATSVAMADLNGADAEAILDQTLDLLLQAYPGWQVVDTPVTSAASPDGSGMTQATSPQPSNLTAPLPAATQSLSGDGATGLYQQQQQSIVSSGQMQQQVSGLSGGGVAMQGRGVSVCSALPAATATAAAAAPPQLTAGASGPMGMPGMSIGTMSAGMVVSSGMPLQQQQQLLQQAVTSQVTQYTLPELGSACVAFKDQQPVCQPMLAMQGQQLLQLQLQQQAQPNQQQVGLTGVSQGMLTAVQQQVMQQQQMMPQQPMQQISQSIGMLIQQQQQQQPMQHSLQQPAQQFMSQPMVAAPQYQQQQQLLQPLLPQQPVQQQYMMGHPPQLQYMDQLQQQQLQLQQPPQQQQLNSGFSQQLVRISLKLHGVTPEKLPANTVAALNTLLANNAAELETLLMSPAIRTGCVQLELDVLVKVPLEPAGQQQQQQGEAAAESREPGTAAASLACCSSALLRAEELLRQCVPFAAIVDTLLSLPVAGATTTAAAPSNSTDPLGGSSGSHKTEAAGLTLGSKLTAIYGQVGDALAAWVMDWQHGELQHDWSLGIDQLLAGAEAAASEDYEVLEEDFESDLEEEQEDKEGGGEHGASAAAAAMYQCQIAGSPQPDEASSDDACSSSSSSIPASAAAAAAAAAAATTARGSTSGGGSSNSSTWRPGLRLGQPWSVYPKPAATNGGSATAAAYEVQLHVLLQGPAAVGGAAAAAGGSPVKLWASMRGMFLGLEASVEPERPADDAAASAGIQLHRLTVQLPDASPGLLLVQAEREVKLGLDPFEAAAAGNGSEPGHTAFSYMSTLLPVVLCGSEEMAAEVEAKLHGQAPESAYQMLVHLGLLLDFGALLKQQQEGRVALQLSEQQRQQQQQLLGNRHYLSAIRFIGYHLQVFAMNNSMTATAAHIGGILRAVQPRASAAAAASTTAAAAAEEATAAEPASCTSCKPQYETYEGEFSYENASCSASFEFEDASCSNRRSTSEGSPGGKPAGSSASGSAAAASSSSKAVKSDGTSAGGHMQGADVSQSPLHILRAALQVMAMLLLMYLVIDLVAAVAKGKNPMHELLRSLKQIKELLYVVMAPLSMMLVGLLLAVFQYEGYRRDPLPRRSGSSVQGSTAAGGGKGYAAQSGDAASCPC